MNWLRAMRERLEGAVATVWLMVVWVREWFRWQLRAVVERLEQLLAGLAKRSDGLQMLVGLVVFAVAGDRGFYWSAIAGFLLFAQAALLAVLTLLPLIFNRRSSDR